MALIYLKGLYFFLVILLATLILYVCQIYSIDIVRYEVSYGNSFSAFEPGWRILGRLSRLISFDQFLWLIFILQACLIALIYNRSKSVIFLPVVLLIIAPSLYTNQIRWGVGSLFVIVLFLRGHNIFSIVSGLIFHKFVILFSPLLYLKKRLNNSFLAIIIVALTSVSIYFLISFFESMLGFSYLGNDEASAQRSVIGLGFSFLVLLSYFSLGSERRSIEIKTLYMLHLMSLSFFWIAIVSGRISDASTILEPFLVRELFLQKKISIVLSCCIVFSWVIRVYLRWAN